MVEPIIAEVLSLHTKQTHIRQQHNKDLEP